MPTHDHTSKQFDTELENLRSRVLQMGGLVEQQVIRAIEGFATGNLELCEQVIHEDKQVNAMEVSIDEDCAHIIARRQPAAGDLRMLKAVLKSSTDIERIGDEATKIARMTQSIYTAERLVIPRFSEIKHSAEIAIEMLRQALDAFARMDAQLAAQVVVKDYEIDNDFRAITRMLVTFMMEDPRTISTCLDVLFVAKALERIGDHAQNFAEHVVYVVKGTDVRHVTPEILFREASSKS